MRLKCLLNADLLAIVGDYSGSEYFFLRFTLTPKRGYLSKIMVVSRNYKHRKKGKFFRVLNTPHGLPYWKPLRRLKYSRTPRRLEVSHWKPVTRFDALPKVEKIVALGKTGWGLHDNEMKQLIETTDFFLSIY